MITESQCNIFWFGEKRSSTVSRIMKPPFATVKINLLSNVALFSWDNRLFIKNLLVYLKWCRSFWKTNFDRNLQMDILINQKSFTEFRIFVERILHIRFSYSEFIAMILWSYFCSCRPCKFIFWILPLRFWLI